MKYICCEGLTLYIKSRTSRIYVVRDGAVVSSFRYDYKSEESQRIAEIMRSPKPVASGSAVYYYIEPTNTIMKTEDGTGMTPVVSMPARSAGIETVAVFLLLSIFGLMRCIGPGDKRFSM